MTWRSLLARTAAPAALRAPVPMTAAPQTPAPRTNAPQSAAPRTSAPTSSAPQTAANDGAASASRSGGPTLLRPRTYECANCAGRFPAPGRPTPYCSPQCGAEAKTVRFGRKLRADHGDELPAAVRTSLHRKVLHALTECAWDKWSGAPEPPPVTPPEYSPLADRLNPNIPERDVFAVRAHQMKVRVLAPTELRPCDAQNWDCAWRGWVNANAR